MCDTTDGNEIIKGYLKGQGTLQVTSLVYTKRGVQRGPAGNKQTYGDDKVVVTFITGFNYQHVVEKSLEKLPGLRAQEILDLAREQGLHDRNGNEIGFPEIQEALLELWASFKKTLAGKNTSTTENVFDPLEVEGQKVPGAKVYTGPGDPSDPKAAVPGTIYLSGLKINERVLEEAANPLPETKSKGKSIAKRLIRAALPVGRYVSYVLSPDSDFDLRVGNTGGIAASEGKVEDLTLAVEGLLDLLS